MSYNADNQLTYVNNQVVSSDKDGNLTDEQTRKHLAKWLEAYVEWVEKKP